MKKLVFANLAMALGAFAAGEAVGQQFAPSHYVASSYPVQTYGSAPAMHAQQAPSLYAPYGQPTTGAGGMQPLASPIPGFPTVPSRQLHQLASTQDGYGFPTPAPLAPEMAQPSPNRAAHPHPHAPMPHEHSPLPHAHAPVHSPQPNANMYPSGGVSHQGHQHLAPACSTCGPNPVSQGIPQFSDYGGPVAFNAPGLSSGFPLGNIGGGQGFPFGGRHRHFAGLPGGAKPWFFGGSYLLFHRVDDKSRPLSLRDADNRDVLATGDAQFNTMNGFQLMGGRYFNCGRNAIQAVYWGLFPDDEQARVAAMPGGAFRSRVLATGDVEIGMDPMGAAGTYDVYDWYDGAEAHYLTRSSEFQNVEVNLLGFGVGGAARNFNRPTAGGHFAGRGGHGHGAACGYCGGAGCGACGADCGTACEPTRFATGPCCYVAPACGSRLNLSWLAGLRYFRFEDNLQYAADFNGDGLTRAIDDLYYDVNTTNDLIGFQWGGRADYCVGRRLNLFANGKVGVYNNRSTLFSRIGTETVAGFEAAMPAMPYVVDVTDNRVAFLSELGTGFGVCLSSKWTATVGYTAIIASGVATAPGNLRERGHFLRDQRHIDNTDVLVLHGLNIGANYNF